MFNQFTALFNTSLKPMNQLVELNISTANTIAHQQGQLMTSLIDDSISFSQKFSATADVTNFLAEQSKFSANVQSQLTEALKQTSGTLTKAKKEAEIILSDSFSASLTKTLAEEQPVVPKMLIKEKPAAKAKAAPKVKAKAASKATPKIEVKAAPKAEVKVAPRTEVKAVPKAEVKEAPKAEVKVAPKAEVKAVPKAEVKVAPKAEVKVAPKAEVKVAPKAEINATPKVDVKVSPKK